MNAAVPITDGLARFEGVLTSSVLADWTSRIDAQYQKLRSFRGPGDSVPAHILPPGERFVPTASSFTVGAVFSIEELQRSLAGILDSLAGRWIQERLGDSIACDLDQSWVRRQYAPRHYPQWHAPHGWHQDGALKFDFNSPSDGALLDMVSCWIALVPCGVRAPGLEFITQRLESLLPPGELTDERVRARFAPEEFWRPELQAGEATLFRGDVLHRTYATPGMTEDRTSIELRFFPANKIPARLQSDRFISFPR